MRRTLSKISQGAVALYKNVFNKCLNCSRLQHCLRLIGSKFHSRGPAAAKHRSPKMLDVQHVTQVAVSADRSRWTVNRLTGPWARTDPKTLRPLTVKINMDAAGRSAKFWLWTSAYALSPISTYTICCGFAVQQAVQQIHNKSTTDWISGVWSCKN